jgi:hypothetical protein
MVQQTRLVGAWPAVAGVERARHVIMLDEHAFLLNMDPHTVGVDFLSLLVDVVWSRCYGRGLGSGIA